MDALTALENRANSASGRSIFENAHLTREQRVQNFARALGEGGGGTEIEVETEDESADALAHLDTDDNEQAAGNAGGREEQPTKKQGDASEASRDEGLPNPSIDLENLERSLAADVGKKAAKTIMDGLARPLAQQVGGVAAQAAQARVERLATKFGNVYPELKRANALNAVVRQAIAMQKQGDTDEVAFKRALVEVYGDRKREMREQTQYQMSAPTRTTNGEPQKATRAQADIAAIRHLQKNPGDVSGAIALKQRLMNG